MMTRTKKVKQQRRAWQHYEELDEGQKDDVRVAAKNLYDYTLNDDISAFDIGKAVAILDSGQRGTPFVGELTSTDLRWLLQDVDFLRDECGYENDQAAQIRLDYTKLTSYLKFYFLYKDWPILARQVPPVIKRVMLANQNSEVSLPTIRKGRKDFKVDPEHLLNQVIQIGIGKGGPTYKTVRRMMKGKGRLYVRGEHELLRLMKQNWKTVFEKWKLKYVDSEISPGLTKSLDFLASRDGVLFVIEVKTNAGQAGYVGELLSNVNEMRLTGSYRKGYRNVSDPIGDMDSRILIQQAEIRGMIIALDFNWRIVLAAYQQTVDLVKLSHDVERIECWVSMECPSEGDLEKLVGAQFPYKGSQFVPYCF